MAIRGYILKKKRLYILSFANAKKVKVKFAIEQVTKVQRGSRGMALLYL